MNPTALCIICLCIGFFAGATARRGGPILVRDILNGKGGDE